MSATRSFVVLLVLAGGIGCRTREGTLVDVSVDAVDASQPLAVASLHVTATLGAATRDFDVPVATKSIPPTQRFGLNVPGDKHGTIVVKVDARNEGGATIATASKSAVLMPGSIVKLELMFGASELPDLGVDLATPLDVAQATTDAATASDQGAGEDAANESDAAPAQDIAPANADLATFCTAHTQCPSQVCTFATGACVSPAEVAYVSNASGCINTPHDSTPPNAPFCEITAALSSGRVYLRVAGSATSYAPLTFTETIGTGTITILGPGVGAEPPARVFQANKDSIKINFTQANTNAYALTIDGLILGGTSSTMTDDIGVHCTNATGAVIAITVRDSLITNHTQNGLQLNKCNLTLERSTVSGGDDAGLELSLGSVATVKQTVFTGNYSGGIAILGTGTTLDLVNSLVANNGSAGTTYPGVHASGGATLRVVNSTIARNMGTTGAHTGVDGNGATCNLFNTVVTDEFGENNIFSCNTTYSAYNGGHGVGDVDLSDCAQEDLFVSWTGFDFHLADGTAFCSLVNVGAGAASGFTAPAIDLEGNFRPAFGAYDIGAYEKQ